MVPRALALLLLAGTAGLPQDVEPLRADEKSGRLTFGARVARQDVHEQLKGFIEYVLVFPGGKEYESLFTCPVEPLALFDAMKKIGLKPGKPAREEDGKNLPPEGSKLRVWVEWADGEKNRREPIETFALDVHSGKPMEPVSWIFTGSREGYDPESDKDVLQVVLLKNLMSFYQDDASVLVQNPVQPKDGHTYKANKTALPKEGACVRIVFEAGR